jgi:hypothetical protein
VRDLQGGIQKETKLLLFKKKKSGMKTTSII